jgi:hypothetical protein
MKKASLIILGLTALPYTAQAASTLSDPLNSGGSINIVLARLIQALLGLVGSLALLMFVWGGFQMLISRGEPDKVKKGKDTLTWATIGIVVIIMAFVIVSSIVTTLEGGSIL